MVKRYHMIVDGRVQGVGFRFFSIQNAHKYHLTGTVHNMSNGMVEIFAQGESDDLNRFYTTIQNGNRFILVTNISLKEIKPIENESDFRCVDYFY